MAVPWSAVLAAVAIHVLWGANVVAVKIGLIAIPPLWSAFWRFVLGALCIAAWARLRGVGLRPERGEWPALLLLGLFFTVQIAVMYVGIDLSSGAIAAILVSTNPLFASLLSHFFVPDDRVGPLRAVGLAVAFGGICIIFVGGGQPFFEISRSGAGWGSLVVLAGAAMLGGRLVYTARLLRRIEATRVMFWQMVLALPAFAGGGLALEQVDWAALDWLPIAGIAYQGVVIAGLGFMVNAYLMSRYNPSVVISFNFVSPISGVLLSALMLSEAIAWNVWAGLATVGLGLLLIARK